ncbi:MAG TPA: phosphoribosylaminoimidazolesuccinocarboxamide synthase [Clostridiales bacterium]|jgi:phosphoribosylaminoimidazole-succinocarboxamide synthase|nr:phosphoribosylaminoimidazolesuccinocarboxamide synthase [Clostridiales bacterium]
MKLVYAGKTKDVYEKEDGNYLLKFKDDVTGENGVFDPGANTVGLKMEGAGLAGLRLTQYFYEKLNAMGVPTHYISADIDAGTMTVRPATAFGQGLEIVCRLRAVGSFYKRYAKYVEEGQLLPAFVEVTLKDDDRGDPPITEDCLDMLGILSKEEYRTLRDRTRQITEFVKNELATKGMELYDIKLEFGRVGEDGQIALIDEISGGSMRAFKDGKQVAPLDLEKLMLA